MKRMIRCRTIASCDVDGGEDMLGRWWWLQGKGIALQYTEVHSGEDGTMGSLKDVAVPLTCTHRRSWGLFWGDIPRRPGQVFSGHFSLSAQERKGFKAGSRSIPLTQLQSF